MAHTEEVKKFPELNLMDKAMLLRGLRNPDYFRNEARPRLYKRCGNDPEMVHELMLDLLHRDGKKISMLLGPFFAPPKGLSVRINGIDVVPFGTAAGMDKNGDALLVFQQIFGMQEPGTVVLNPREGNKRVRVATLDAELDLVNAQGFPSMGLDYFARNIAEYRRAGGKAKVYVSICGLPVSDGNVIETAMKERLGNLLRTYYVEYNEKGFKLASGAVSKHYINLKRGAQDPEAAMLIGSLGHELIATSGREISHVGGKATGSIAISQSIVNFSAFTDYPLKGFYVRNAHKDYGMGDRIEGFGIIDKPKMVVIVDDVHSTGGSMVDAINALRDKFKNVKIPFAFSVVNRQLDNKVEKETGVKHVSLFTLEDLLRV